LTEGGLKNNFEATQNKTCIVF